MGKISRWLNTTILKSFRDKWWKTKTEVRGKIIDPYSYQLGFEHGVESTRPKGGVFVKLSDEELELLRGRLYDASSVSIRRINE